MTPQEAGLGWLLAFVISMLTVPVGVSGAVFLLPVQVSVLHVASPAVTPTNLIYNVVAIPGALARYWRTGRLRGPLVRRLALGTLPGVVIGAVIRVQFAAGGDVFRVLLSLLLLPLGLWLLFGSPGRARAGWTLDSRRVSLLALAVGVVGGLYGIGGGSILAPILVAGGYAVTEVAPAALSATFLTSLVGVATYALMTLAGATSAAPDLMLGLWLGSAGFIGAAIGARLQPRLPERGLRRSLGALAMCLAIGYLLAAIMG